MTFSLSHWSNFQARPVDSSKNKVWTLSLAKWGKFTYGGQLIG